MGEREKSKKIVRECAHAFLTKRKCCADCKDVKIGAHFFFYLLSFAGGRQKKGIKNIHTNQGVFVASSPIPQPKRKGL
jgi:hypothetical protein